MRPSGVPHDTGTGRHGTLRIRQRWSSSTDLRMHSQISSFGADPAQHDQRSAGAVEPGGRGMQPPILAGPGIPVLLLKGPDLQDRLYGTPPLTPAAMSISSSRAATGHGLEGRWCVPDSDSILRTGFLADVGSCLLRAKGLLPRSALGASRGTPSSWCFRSLERDSGQTRCWVLTACSSPISSRSSSSWPFTPRDTGSSDLSGARMSARLPR